MARGGQKWRACSAGDRDCALRGCTSLILEEGEARVWKAGAQVK